MCSGVVALGDMIPAKVHRRVDASNDASEVVSGSMRTGSNVSGAPGALISENFLFRRWSFCEALDEVGRA